ncbi:MAG: ferritin-like domain-containing protein [Planctomycetota bacterium]|jgi:rubrerythrin
MDIFEFAINMERDGRQYYLDLVSKTSHAGLQNIFRMLAEDEHKHEQIIAQSKSGNCGMAETTVLETAKNVFQQARELGQTVDLSGDEAALYRHAMELEQKSISFYLDRAEQEDQPQQKQLFETLADEEKKHYRLLEGLVDFVTQPDTWLEDAEFTHLTDY